MKRMLSLLLAITSLPGIAQDLNALTATNVLDGKTVALADYDDATGLVVILTSNACPYDAYYTGRIVGLINTYGNRLPILLVNSNLGENESTEAMKEKAKEWNIDVPYLADKDQVFLTWLKGQKSPEAFVLKRTGDQLKIFYHGAIDDNAQVPGDVHETYLKNAVEALLNNTAPPKAEVRAVGCLIRKK